MVQVDAFRGKTAGGYSVFFMERMHEYVSCLSGFPQNVRTHWAFRAMRLSSR